MMNIKKIEIKFFILIPLMPLLDMFIFNKPVLTISSYLSILFYVLFMRKIKLDNRIIIIIMYVINAVFASIVALLRVSTNETHLLYFTIVLFFFTIIGIVIGSNLDQYFKTLSRMVYLYAFLIVIIYIYRMILYNFNFSQARGNIGMYGGNSAHLSFLFLLFLLRKKRSKGYIFFLMFAMVHAIMFVSKGAIFITVLWIIFDFINLKKIKLFSKKTFGLGILAIIGYKAVEKTSFDEFIFLRFKQWLNGIAAGSSLLGSRSEIFLFAINFMKENPYTFLFGIGPSMFRTIHPLGYSNTHNFILDILVETGMFSLIIILVIIGITFFKTNQKIYYLMCIAYGTFEGVSMFHVDDIFVIGYVYMFLIILYLESFKKRNIDFFVKKNLIKKSV